MREMSIVISRMVWFVVVAAVLSYASYLLLGSIVNAQAAGKYEPVLIRDELAPGAHYLSGMVMVPTPCHQLSVRTEAVSDTAFMLLLRTWREPSVDCAKNEMPRHFRAVLFAPSAGIEFGATLDGKGLPIVVLPVISGR